MANSVSKTQTAEKAESGQPALVVGLGDYPNAADWLPAVAADVGEMAKFVSSKRGVFASNGVRVPRKKKARECFRTF